MGGDNAQKSKMAREVFLYVILFLFKCRILTDAQKKEYSEMTKTIAKRSPLESNKKAMTIQCKVCMQKFICTTSEVKCRKHAETKHPKADVYACFPHLKK